MFRAEDVSVVIPAYNHERFVAEAVASVQNQSLLPRDIVVVDDGSTDRTAEVVAAAEIPALSLLREENQGAHVALNRAIAIGAGRWIAILNSDDAFEPERLERALGVAREEEAALVIGRVKLIDETGAALGPEHPTAVWYAEALAALERAGSPARGARAHNFAVTTSNFFVRKELWAALGGFRAFRWVHDYDFLLRALALCPERVVFEPSLEDVRYRVHPGNTITRNVEGALTERASMMKAHGGLWRRALHGIGWAPGRDHLRRALASRDFAPPSVLAGAEASGDQEPIRCGLVVENLDKGGLEMVVASLALLLPAHGIEPFLLCASSGGTVAGRLARAGIPLYVAGGRRDLWRAWADEVRPHVISTHFMPFDFLETMASHGIPTVETVHNTYAWLGPHDWEKEAAKQRLLSGIVAVSRTADAYHARHIPGRADPLAIIPNGVQPERVCTLPRNYARAALGLSASDRMLVHVGRICPQKNQTGLVAAFREALRANANALLVLVGDGSDRAYSSALEASGADLVASRRLRILPHTDDVATILSAADAWVSNSFFEGWSVGATEALCCGLPVVLSDCGGSRELAGSSGERGTVVPNPAGDPLAVSPRAIVAPDPGSVARNRDALAAAMLDVIGGRFGGEDARAEIRTQRAREGRARFAADAMAAAHAAVLRRAVAGEVALAGAPSPVVAVPR